MKILGVDTELRFPRAPPKPFSKEVRNLFAAFLDKWCIQPHDVNKMGRYHLMHGLTILGERALEADSLDVRSLSNAVARQDDRLSALRAVNTVLQYARRPLRLRYQTVVKNASMDVDGEHWLRDWCAVTAPDALGGRRLSARTRNRFITETYRLLSLLKPQTLDDCRKATRTAVVAAIRNRLLLDLNGVVKMGQLTEAKSSSNYLH